MSFQLVEFSSSRPFFFRENLSNKILFYFLKTYIYIYILYPHFLNDCQRSYKVYFHNYYLNHLNSFHCSLAAALLMNICICFSNCNSSIGVCGDAAVNKNLLCCQSCKCGAQTIHDSTKQAVMITNEYVTALVFTLFQSVLYL